VKIDAALQYPVAVRPGILSFGFPATIAALAFSFAQYFVPRLYASRLFIFFA